MPAHAAAEVELRFEGSEELGYDPLGTPPRGEICLRGPLMFRGYYQDQKKTEEAFGAAAPALTARSGRQGPPRSANAAQNAVPRSHLQHPTSSHRHAPRPGWPRRRVERARRCKQVLASALAPGG
jgi:acyl-CoA synthetase (AMP-forming)/AMP-acid ligase II